MGVGGHISRGRPPATGLQAFADFRSKSFFPVLPLFWKIMLAWMGSPAREDYSFPLCDEFAGEARRPASWMAPFRINIGEFYCIALSYSIAKSHA
jgi:hypothetical protein